MEIGSRLSGDKCLEYRFSRHIVLLVEECIRLEVGCHGHVLGCLHIRLLVVQVDLLHRLWILVESVMRLCSQIICLGFVGRRLLSIVNHLVAPFNDLGHLALYKSIYRQLIAKILFGIQNLLVGIGDGFKRSQSSTVIFAGHVEIRHQCVHLIDILGIWIIAYKILEGNDALAERRVLQVADLYIVVHCLFAHYGVDIVSNSSRIR